MEIKKDNKLNEEVRNWYDFELENIEKLNKLILYLTTYSNNFTITARKKDEKKYIGYVICEINLNEEKIERFYEEIKNETC